MTLLEELCASHEPILHSVPPHTTAGGDLTDLGSPVTGGSSGPGISGGASGSPGTTTVSKDLTDVPCWVARAVYGVENPRWREFREWLLNEAPVWFRVLYLRLGPSIARWLRLHPAPKPILRRWMDLMIGY